MMMTWIDLVIIGIFFFSLVAGFIRGFIGEIISLITLIACFLIALYCASPLAQMIMSSQTMQNILGNGDQAADGASKPAFYLAIGLSFILVFMATMIVGAFIKVIFNAILHGAVLGLGNRILGAVFGLVRGYILNLILIFLIQLTAFTEKPAWQNSLLVPKFEPSINWINHKIQPTLQDLKEKYEEKLQQNASDANPE